MEITVVLPAYNEEQNLHALLERTVRSLGSSGFSYSILVIDDGSTDGTPDVVLRAARSWPVRLIRQPRNMGLGTAIRRGLTEASRRGGVVITMDADNSHDPTLIPAMVSQLEAGFDVVIASRFQTGGREIGVPAYRRLLSRVVGAAMRLLIRYPGVLDYSSGYRAYNALILQRLQEEFGSQFIRENGFACMLELLVRLKAVRAKVTEVPLILRYDLKSGPSKMCFVQTMLRYAVVLWSTLRGRTLITQERSR